MRILKFINQQLIKDTNMKHLYTSIYHNPGISRAHLSKQTALSKTTVSTLIDELIERNFILDGGAGNDGILHRIGHCLEDLLFVSLLNVLAVKFFYIILYFCNKSLLVKFLHDCLLFILGT